MEEICFDVCAIIFEKLSNYDLIAMRSVSRAFTKHVDTFLHGFFNRFLHPHIGDRLTWYFRLRARTELSNALDGISKELSNGRIGIRAKDLPDEAVFAPKFV